MSEEKAVVETDEEVQLEDTLDQVDEETQDASEKDVVDEDDGQEAEETDEKGVPLKNRLAEAQRKLAVAEERARLYQEFLNKQPKQKPEEDSTLQNLIESVSDSEFEAVGISKEVAAVLRKSQSTEARKALLAKEREINAQVKENQRINAEFAKDRFESVKSFQEDSDGEFGNLVVPDGNGGLKYDETSKLFKRASEIFNSSPRLQKLSDGPARAADKAEKELMKAKYGKTTPKKKNPDRMKATGSGRESGGSSGVKHGGKFYRKLDTSPGGEFDKLSREEQSEYNVWETMERTK